MNISTLAKILGVSISDLREAGTKKGLYGFFGRNTRIPYNSAVEVTKILRPDKVTKLQNDDKIYLPEVISVTEFAETIGRPVSAVIKTLMLSGVIATMNEKIDFDTATIIADELGVDVHPENPEMLDSNNSGGGDTNLIKIVEYSGLESDKIYEIRPPVITVMGHVDHGKTTLLDTIRKTNVVASESGSITQHIASYQIEFIPKTPGLDKLHLPKGKKGGYKITFIDTPGHEAFTAMRARGSQLADYIVLLVSAVEGPKPQTVEVIERAKLGKIPIIVALNKIDLPDSDPERVKTELTNFGLVPEEWGGETIFVPISAKTGENIDKILEIILENSELLELKGQVKCPGQAIVIESNMDPKLGVITTCVVVKGEIKMGDIIRCGENVSKIKKLESTDKKPLQKAEIGMPFVMLGLAGTVNIGDPVICYETVKSANNDASIEALKKSQNKRVFNVTGKTIAADNQINLVIKADVHGSLEALKESILKIPQDKVKIVIKSEGVGPITENDFDFAQTSGSTIIAFHTDIPSKIEIGMKNKGQNFIQSNIIYELIEWVEEEVLKSIKHETKEVEIGRAKVLQLFKADKPGLQVFGGEVIDGKIFSGKELKLLKNNEEVCKLDIQELQRNKVKTTEVNISQQFGMLVKGAGKNKITVGDIVVCFDTVIVK